jgi:hemerythrin-like domain-containing protein
MCSYCGCRALPEIGVLMGEHEQIINAAGALARAVAAGSGPTAWRPRLHELVRALESHVEREEGGLFAELRGDPEFGLQVAGLCDEHDDLDALTAAVDKGDLAAVGRLVDLLYRHIGKEDNGLFPAVAVAVDADTWAAVEARVAARVPARPVADARR